MQLQGEPYMRKHFTNFILMFILFVGLSLLLYPTASDYWNSHHQTRAITTYADNVAALDHARYEELLEAARQYNEKLASQEPHYRLSEEEKEEYESTLEVSDTGIMGYIEIPEIDVKLPIYHGTDDAVLQTAAGHLEWTSLPVGGESTHCVISGHRGLPSAKLFTSLDKLREGDTFLLRVLDEVLTYEVDQILIVEPQDTEALQIEEGKDYCTLMTCTPYGINTHRLLVRGHRIENAEEAREIRVTADAMQVDPFLVAPVVGVLLLLIILLASHCRRKR